MSTGPRIPLAEALDIAANTLAILRPHCHKADTAGSVRRQSPMFAGGFAAAVEQWPKIIGGPDSRYTKRMLPCGLKLDLFMPHPDGYGLIMAIRTGSADWAHKVLATSWKRAGFHSDKGLLRREDGSVVPCRTERELFDVIGLRWVEPMDREVGP